MTVIEGAAPGASEPRLDRPSAPELHDWRRSTLNGVRTRAAWRLAMPFRSSRTWLGAALCTALLTVASPAAGLTPDEATLLERLPAGIQPTCLPATSAGVSPIPLAALVCDLRTGPGVVVTYERFVSHAAASARYESQLTPDATGRTLGIGGCPSALPSERAYLQDNLLAGRRACSIGADGAARIVWLDSGQAVVGIATRADGDIRALAGWWAQSARLTAPPDTGLLAIGGHFPDPVEHRLFRQLNPGMPSECRRPSGLQRSGAGAVAAVLCLDRGESVLVQVIQYAPSVRLGRRYLARLADFGVRPGAGGACAARIPSERAYATISGAGRYACAQTSGGVSVLLWIDRKRRLLGIAATKRLDPGALQTWWRDHAR